jgi:hypothetical protein
VRALVTALLIAFLIGVPAAFAAVPPDGPVATYHGAPDRAGAYIIPGLTGQSVSRMHRDTAFDGQIDGHIYAQPLYWRPAGAAHGLIVVAGESNVITALDAETGRTAWKVSLGPPAPKSALPCGNIDPLGITGTPVIDSAAGAMYLDAMVLRGAAPAHLVFGVRVTDGAVLPGWPIDVQQALQAANIPFTPSEQNQRAAMAMLGGRVFIAFSGHFGDCGNYHGIVLGLAINPPRPAAGWATAAGKGGIWAPGGISSDGQSLFVSTGNTQAGQQWGNGEAVIRLGADLRRSDSPPDFFAPANWKALDDSDLDLAGVAPLPIDLAGARLLLALGKDGKAYLLNRDNLGGIGGQLAMQQVAGAAIITAPATFPWQGRMLVVYQARRAGCPDGSDRPGLAALAVSAAGRPGLEIAWCALLDGRGAPIVTQTENGADPIVWIAGAEGDDRLHAFRGDTGQSIWTSPEPLTGLRHFATLIAAEGRLYIAGDGRVYSFTAR